MLHEENAHSGIHLYHPATIPPATRHKHKSSLIRG